jgi:hypothetical protein
VGFEEPSDSGNHKEELALNPIKRKINSFVRHLQQQGFRMTFWLVRRSLYNYWMVGKLRVLTSNAANIFRQKS